MKYIKSISIIALLLSGLICNSIFAQDCKEKRLNRNVEKKIRRWQNSDIGLKQFQSIKVDSFSLSLDEKKLHLYFAPDLSYLPFREDETKKFYSSLSKEFGRKLGKYQLSVISNKSLIQDLVPNWARKDFPQDEKRKEFAPANRIPLVRKPDEPVPSKGFYNNNLVVWPSHGYYYEADMDRWEYQRARLFSTVEDIHPTMYVLQYLVPMLENAGAEVFLPRERDTQVNEVIVDNDDPGQSQIIGSDLKYDIINKGFAPKDTLFTGDKPFESGTSIKITTSLNAQKSLAYIPNIPEKGRYAVYISYLRDNTNSSEVEYIVRHLGGETRFLVNQKIGGSTWVYLGTFKFNSGNNQDCGAVVINIKGNENGIISADAVRFGGGMGNVARRPLNASFYGKGLASGLEMKNGSDYKWKLSKKPRYMEASRYYLQYAGMPDTLVYNLNKDKNDYTDDLQSRGEWINYLIGSSKPQYRSSFNSGLNIPIDLSLAIHTDAGTTPNDSVIGTLCIYSTEKNNGTYPNGQSKMTNRDLADMIQSQVVDDIRKQFKTDWTRRAMWDRGYSEAYRQIVPALLLELLSHQNANDMHLSLDPRFRFTASRAIYKGMLKYLAFQNNRSYVIQPLPVDHFGISIIGKKTIELKWKPVNDSIEVTAKPDKYKVYCRIGDGGFDNGVEVTDTFLRIELKNYDQIYSFKITAFNEGGESFPSEILAVGIKNEEAPAVLVVNNFNRISGPAFFDQGEMSGIAWWEDQGVPYLSEIGHTGNQYDFDRKSEWKDDDSPGWGASYGNMEGKIIPGNTFDFSYTHGEAIMANGFSFVSVSDEVFKQKQFNVSPFQIVDVILGEEKSIPSFLNKNKKEFQIYTPDFLNKLAEVTSAGNSLFLSGAYSGTDLLNTGDSTAIKFARDVLHIQWRSNHAVSTGNVYSADDAVVYFNGQWVFNTSYDPAIYTVEAPDAIDPETGAYTIFRYSENNSSAGVAYKGKYKSLVFGFPFETIINSKNRNELMGQILGFLKK